MAGQTWHLCGMHDSCILLAWKCVCWHGHVWGITFWQLVCALLAVTCLVCVWLAGGKRWARRKKKKNKTSCSVVCAAALPAWRRHVKKASVTENKARARGYYYRHGVAYSPAVLFIQPLGGTYDFWTGVAYPLLLPGTWLPACCLVCGSICEQASDGKYSKTGQDMGTCLSLLLYFLQCYPSLTCLVIKWQWTSFS